MDQRGIGVVREWYRDRFGMEIPDTRLIEIPRKLVTPPLGNTTFYIPGAEAEECDAETIEENKQAALGLLLEDPDIARKEFTAAGPEELFWHVLSAEEREIQGRARDLREVREYAREETGNRIYVFPDVAALYHERRIAPKFFDAQLAHMILHQWQEQTGIRRSMPYVEEGPAQTLQTIYGIEQLGLEEYRVQEELFSNAMNPNGSDGAFSMSPLKIATARNVVEKELGFNLEGRMSEYITAFPNILDPTKYQELEVRTIYEFTKSRILGKTQP